MLRERNEQVTIFETLSPFSTTDLDPELQKISDFLDAHPEILNCFTEQAIPATEQVIRQTERRILHDEKLSSSEKILNIHQPNTLPFAKANEENQMSLARYWKSSKVMAKS